MLRDKLANDLNTSMKTKNICSTATLRLILAALKDRYVASRTGQNNAKLSEEEDDHETRQMLTKMIKQRRESVQVYEESGREDLADREAAEIIIIQSYLPSQMSDTEMATAITNAIDKLGASCIKDMGRTMSALKVTYSGRMDFSKASNIVKEHLTSPQ